MRGDVHQISEEHLRQSFFFISMKNVLLWTKASIISQAKIFCSLQRDENSNVKNFLCTRAVTHQSPETSAERIC